jgi:hypothetical protein
MKIYGRYLKESVQCHNPAALCLGKEPLVCGKQKAGWGLRVVLDALERKKILLLPAL